MVRICYADISHLPGTADGFPISEYRKSRLSTLRPIEKRRQGLGAELLLIKALIELDPLIPLPLTILADENGKPYLPDRAFHFSLSHSGLFAACATSDRPIGLDLEATRLCEERVVHRFFSKEEQVYIANAQDPDAAYTELWTRKESWLKALGVGLQAPLASYDTINPPEGVCFWHRAQEGVHFTLCSLGGDPMPECFQKIKLP